MKTQATEVERWMRKLAVENLSIWPCPYCDHEPFSNHQKRNNHIRHHHPEQPLPKMSKPEALARKRIMNARYRSEKHSQQPFRRGRRPWKTRAEKLAGKRAYNAWYRSENIAKGLTSSGKPRKKPNARFGGGPSEFRGKPLSTRLPADELPTDCPLCGNHYSNRSTLGIHVRDIHHKSLFDLPPYKKIDKVVDKVVEKFDRGGPVLQHFDTSRAEVRESSGTTVTIDDGKTSVIIKTRFDLKELVNYILET